jgi:hypothetical protein
MLKRRRRRDALLKNAVLPLVFHSVFEADDDGSK